MFIIYWKKKYDALIEETIKNIALLMIAKKFKYHILCLRVLGHFYFLLKKIMTL